MNAHVLDPRLINKPLQHPAHLTLLILNNLCSSKLNEQQLSFLQFLRKAMQIHGERVSVVNAFFGFDPHIQGLRVKHTQNQLL